MSAARTLLVSGAALLGLWACSKAPEPAPPLSAPALTVSATHAIKVPAPVKALAASPNDVASWLGLIAMISDEGELIITNIEGSNPRYPGSSRYIDIIGMESIGLPATFFALDEDGRLRPFVEADDQSNFKPAPISVDAPPLSRLCSASGDSVLTALSQSGDILSFDVNLKDGISLTAKPARRAGRPKSVDCTVTAKGELFTLSHDGGGYVLSGEALTTRFAGAETQPLSLASLAGTDGQDYLIVSGLQEAATVIFDAATLEPINLISVQSGLSIKGLKGAAAIAATSEGFGGSAFNDGIIIMADADAPRLVILSRGYALSQLAAAAEAQTEAEAETAVE